MRVKEKRLNWFYFQNVDKFLNQQLMGKMDEFLLDSKIPLSEAWAHKKHVVVYVREILKSLAAQVKNAYFPFFDQYSFDNRTIEKNCVRVN